MTWQAALAFGMSPTIAGGAQSQIRVRFRDGRETRLEMKRRIQEQGPANWTLLLSIQPRDNSYLRLIIQPMNTPAAMPTAKVVTIVSTG